MANRLGYGVNLPFDVIGTSALAAELKSAIYRAAKVSNPVIIYGEVGTEIENVAMLLHIRSQRYGRFIPVNCAELERIGETDSLGLLFGSERQPPYQAGYLEAASNGTLFLNRFNRMPEPLQSRILKVADYNVRLVMGSNADLEGRLDDTIKVPPLRERPEDLLLIVKQLWRHYARKYGHSNFTLDEESVHLLKSYSWPGNFMELRLAIERAVLYKAIAYYSGSDASAIIGPDYFKGELIRTNSGEAMPIHETALTQEAFEDTIPYTIIGHELLGHVSASTPLPDFMENLRLAIIKAAVQKEGTVAAAARMLGYPRSTARQILNRAKNKG